MVLIAVAVLLGLWGLYALTQNGGETNASGGGTTETAAATPAPATPASPASSAASSAPATDTATDEADKPEADKDAAKESESKPAEEPAKPADATAPAEPKINVLNNSLEPGIAEGVYNSLRDQGADMGEHGNLPDSDVVVPETTVFYNEGDAAGEKAARELAERVNRENGVPAVAKPNDPNMPNEFTGPGQITLVLTGGINL